MKQVLSRALEAIEENGILLVFPIRNQKNPPSIWAALHPRTPMRWEWDEDGDDRVAQLWDLREELSRSQKVIYAKWFQGRATFFAKEAFVNALAVLNRLVESDPLGRIASEIERMLRFDSPQSAKMLRAALDLRGKALAPIYEKAMKELWTRLRIVGFGEIDDGAFPSLAVGSTQLLFEDLWQRAEVMKSEEAMAWLESKLGAESLFFKYLVRTTQLH